MTKEVEQRILKDIEELSDTLKKITPVLRSTINLAVVLAEKTTIDASIKERARQLVEQYCYLFGVDAVSANKEDL